MKRTAAVLFLALFACSVSLSAQAQGMMSMADDEASVWSFIQEQWQASADKDMAAFEATLHDRLMSWSMQVPTPRDKAATMKWQRYSTENSTELVRELVPLGIIVEGNVAVAHYIYSVASENRDGERETTHGRYTDVLVRDGDGWMFLAWQGGDDPSDDD